MVTEGIEVVFRLPYRLMLPDGEYVIFPRRHTLQITHPEVLSYTLFKVYYHFTIVIFRVA